MEIAMHRKKSVSTKVSKEIVPFQEEFPILECDVKNYLIGHPESDKKIRLRLPVLLGIRLRIHPKTSDFLGLRFRNPAHSIISRGHTRRPVTSIGHQVGRRVF